MKHYLIVVLRRSQKCENIWKESHTFTTHNYTGGGGGSNPGDKVSNAPNIDLISGSYVDTDDTDQKFVISPN